MIFRKKHIQKKNPKIGVALGGGGARGIIHISLLEAIEELGFKPSVISSCSMGSVIGAFYGSGMSFEDMKSFFTKISYKDLFNHMEFSFSKEGILRGNKLMDSLKPFIKDSFSELHISFRPVATSFWERKPLVLQKGSVLKAVRASISIPGIFIPVTYNKKLLIDGSLSNPLPIDLLTDCDIIIGINVVDLVPDKKQRLAGPHLFMTTFQMIQELLTQKIIALHKCDLYFKPKSTLSIYTHEFTKGKEILDNAKKDKALFKKQLKRLLKQKGYL